MFVLRDHISFGRSVLVLITAWNKSETRTAAQSETGKFVVKKIIQY